MLDNLWILLPSLTFRRHLWLLTASLHSSDAAEDSLHRLKLSRQAFSLLFHRGTCPARISGLGRVQHSAFELKGLNREIMKSFEG